MNKMKLIFILISAFSLCSCSVFMAAHQPDKNNLNFLKPGVHQSAVRGRAWAAGLVWRRKWFPSRSFQIHSGVQQRSKSGPSSLPWCCRCSHPWSVGNCGTPIELMESGTDTSLRIIYDQSLRIQRVEIHQEGKINVIDIGNPGGARR